MGTTKNSTRENVNRAKRAHVNGAFSATVVRRGTGLSSLRATIEFGLRPTAPVSAAKIKNTVLAADKSATIYAARIILTAADAGLANKTDRLTGRADGLHAVPAATNENKTDVPPPEWHADGLKKHYYYYYYYHRVCDRDCTKNKHHRSVVRSFFHRPRREQKTRRRSRKLDAQYIPSVVPASSVQNGYYHKTCKVRELRSPRRKRSRHDILFTSSATFVDMRRTLGPRGRQDKQNFHKFRPSSRT